MVPYGIGGQHCCKTNNAFPLATNAYLDYIGNREFQLARSFPQELPEITVEKIQTGKTVFDQKLRAT